MNGYDPNYPKGPYSGLTIRDELIRSAMMAFATGVNTPNIDAIAKNAVALADAIIKESYQ